MLDLERCGLAEAAEALHARQIRAVDLLEQAFERIHRYNPAIAALSDLVEETAVAEARKVDARRESGEALGPLAGIPMAIKDLIDTVPARCSAGLPFLKDYVPRRDAEVVRRLRRAGAVIVGVGATDPGAFSVRTPAVVHPQAPGHDVGGSSGGSGAALAAGFCLGALGTDTGGSIRIPSACCSLTGLKPTTGRNSLKGIRPLAWSLDHVGPMARRAHDIALIQGVLDPRFAKEPHGSERPLRIGHAEDYYKDAHPIVHKAMDRAISAAASAGHAVRRASLPHPDEVLKVHMVNLPSEAAAYHFATFPGRLEEYPEIARETLELARSQTGFAYVQAQNARRELRARVDRVFRDLDIVLVPTLPVTAPLKETEIIVLDGTEHPALLALIRYTCLFDQSGHPSIAMPAMAAGDGLSVSVQAVAARGADRRLAAFAESFESRLQVKPTYPIRI